MLDWISKKRRDKKRKEAHEKILKKSLAEKVSKYESYIYNNHIGESKKDFTDITIGGEKLRVAKEQITLTDLWTEQIKSSGQRGSGFEEDDSKFGFETIAPILDSASKNRPDGIDDDEPKYEIKTIDLLLEPTSEHRSNKFEEDESKYEIETIDLSNNPALKSRAHRCKEDETDLEFATTNQALEFKSLGCEYATG